MAQVNCRNFNGYKPCGKSTTCNELCSHLDEPLNYILVVHLEAMGAVLRATSLLPSIKRKYPKSHITWVTKKPSNLFFNNNPLVDRVLTTSNEDLLKLKALKFDFGFCIDKSLEAIGVVKSTEVDILYGFTSNRAGAIVPANESSKYLWELGLDNNKKFFENKKPETQLMKEAFELTPFIRDEYQVFLTEEELAESEKRRKLWLGVSDFIIGLNTGCAPTIPFKKLTVEFQRQLVKEIQLNFNAKVVLLGGPDDTKRNQQIAYGLDVISSDTNRGLRDGLVSMNACDMVISGDSLGMHMAIALKKWVIAWFGPTCAHEIDLYDRGRKLITKANCSPCWKRSCHKQTLCYDLVEIDCFIDAIQQGLTSQKNSYFFNNDLTSI